MTRGSAKRLENSAYSVAETRLPVRRIRSTPNAPVPSPELKSSSRWRRKSHEITLKDHSA